MRPPLPSHLLSRTRTRTTATLRSSTPSRIRPRRNNHTSSTSPEPVKPTNPPHNQTSPNPASNKTTTTPPPPDAGTPATTPSTAAPPSPATAPAGSGSGSRTLRQVIVQGPLGNLGRAYSRVQARRPYATQLWSSVIVYLCGDLSAQYFFPPGGGKPVQQGQEEGGCEGGEEGQGEGKGRGYDPWRTLRHLTVGATSSIPSYNWFMFLHHNFNFASKFLSILTKVCVQQAVFTPVFNTYFFSVHSLLSGASLEETWERLKKALPVSIVNSCKLWPGVTAFSFMYVAPQFRNIFSGCIAVGWQTYLSWLNQKAAREVEAAEAAAELAGEGALSSSSSPVEATIGLKA